MAGWFLSKLELAVNGMFSDYNDANGEPNNCCGGEDSQPRNCHLAGRFNAEMLNGDNKVCC